MSGEGRCTLQQQSSEYYSNWAQQKQRKITEWLLISQNEVTADISKKLRHGSPAFMPARKLFGTGPEDSEGEGLQRKKVAGKRGETERSELSVELFCILDAVSACLLLLAAGPCRARNLRPMQFLLLWLRVTVWLLSHCFSFANFT